MKNKLLYLMAGYYSISQNKTERCRICGCDNNGSILIKEPDSFDDVGEDYICGRREYICANCSFFNEKNIIEKFRALCIPGLSPEKMVFLENEIIPMLRKNKQ